MATSWLLLFIGAALCQSALTLSPIPVPEEEWEDFARMLRDPAYRLPTTTRPERYEVSLTPYFDTNLPQGVGEFTFDGTVTIYITAQANVNQVVLHCNDLTIQTLQIGYQSFTDDFVDITSPNQQFTCEMPYSFLRIQTTEDLTSGRSYIIRSTFRGNLQDNMRGFYKSWYRDNTTRRWMATTQFQPGHARQAFPCYDEPGFKAYFDITINREADFSPTISNMPIRTTTTLENGRTSETFHTTPKTSTYLLAFIVSHYQEVAKNDDEERPFTIYARNNIGTDGEWSLDIGEKLLHAMEEYTGFPYYTMAPNITMQQAAIPDFSAGAMENWGLLTYREALILYNEVNSNHFYKQRVANIVSHEVAHMWFGNLVTCAWWDVLWLNEGFARFYQYYLTAKVAPDLGYEIRFITEQLHVSMLSDSIDSAHALTDPSVNDPTTVSAHFSTITYAKGASILRMTQYLLGIDTYEKGLRNYLSDNAFDVASPSDLFHALDAAAIEDRALEAYPGITIEQYFKTWSESAGHPLLTVNVDHQTGQMTVTQMRFNRNTGQSAFPRLYQIPITWTRGNSPDFDNTKPVAVLTGTATVIQRGTTGLEWVIFNKQNTGFYRVNYDRITWVLITRALRGTAAERNAIHEYNRANIVDDLFVFARANVLSYTRAMNTLSYLEFEDAYAPWDAAITGFNFVVRRLAHDSDNLQKLRDEIVRLSAAVVNKLGFSEPAEESYMDGLQRMYIMQFLCNNGHQGCIDAAVSAFQAWRNSGVAVPANMRPWVYCTGLRRGNADDFDFYWAQYLQTDLANNQVVMLQAAGCTSDQSSLERYLDAIVADTDEVRPQDYTTALNSAVSGNEENTLRVFEWLKRNIQPTTDAFGSIATPLSYIAARLLTENDIAEFETWVTANRAVIGESAYSTGINGAASAGSNLQWSAGRIGELASYFETGYVAEDIVIPGEDGDNGSGEGAGEGDGSGDSSGEDSSTTPVPDQPDSANIAALSFITLIVTLSMNVFV